MSDLFDLPLFAEPMAPQPSIEPVSASAAPAILARPSAQIIPFPPCCDVRLVADLADTFVRLRERHGRRCRTMLIAQRFKPLQARLRRLKIPADVIRDEMVCLEKAVACLVWERDGRPELAPRGGGAA